MPDSARNFGFGALAVAVLAAGTSRELAPRTASVPTHVELVTDTPPSAPPLGDSVVTGTALLEEFFGDSLSHLDRCTDPAKCYDLDFLFVSLPDPLDSFLDWAFDADLESMRRALESTSFVANRFWLPWDEDRRIIAGHTPTQYRRNHPGVFLFRNSNPLRHRLRLVYVVGEISTGGVHKHALQAALDERRALLSRGIFADATGARDTIRFVGPFFTGSALSTRLTVERWRNATSDSSFALFMSGAASGPANLFVFDSSGDAPRPAWRMSFQSTVNSDLTLTEAMLRVMVDSVHGLGIPPDHIALVQESSTQYGQQAAGRSEASDGGIPLPVRIVDSSRLSRRLKGITDSIAGGTRGMVVVPYPMSIASLRAEYAKHPASAMKSKGLDEDSEPRIPLPLDDSNQQLESPSPVAQTTPASIELMIDEITQTLRAHDVRAIGVVGTDVRDKIFLADRLRKELPDARLFTLGSNDLYLREEYNSSLRGMLVFSTYPLFLENQWWDPVSRVQGRRFAFASDDAEGIFNATLRQLGRSKLREYRAPFDTAGEYPPVWVTAVGRHTFIPIRAFSSLGGSAEFLEAVGVRVPKADKEDHVSQSDWVKWLTYIAAAGLILVLVLRADAECRASVPVHEKSAPTSMSSAANPISTEGTTEEIAIRRFVERRRRGLRAALLLHREIYTFLRHLALLCVFATLAVIFVPPRNEYSSLRWASPAAYAVLSAIAFAALGAFGVRAREVWIEWGGAYRDYVYHPPRKWMERELARTKRFLSRIERNNFAKALSLLTPTVEYEIRALAPREERNAWRREGVVIAIVALVGMSYAIAVAKLVIDLNALDVSTTAMFVHRASQLDSGVSPIFPIALSGAALAIICTWQLSRLRLLDEVTAFEEAFQHRSSTAPQTDAGETKSRIALGLNAARIHLSSVIPGLPTGLAWVVSAVLIAVLASALWMHFEPSFEGITGLNRTAGYTAFDIVFRLSILMIFAAATWGLVRLVSVWRSLRVTLRALDASPLITAFERLPRRIARLTRLTLFADPSRDTVLAVTATQWMHLRSLFVASEDAFKEIDATAFEEVSRIMCDETPLSGGRHRRAGFTFAPQLTQLFAVIERFWDTEPATKQIDAVLEGLKGESHADGVSTSGRIRRSAPDEVRLWVRSAEEFVAVQAVDYVAWVLRHLRRLVLMLLFLLIVTMALLSSYSFLPQSVVRSLFLALFIAVAVSLVILLSQMNRDEVLSRVMRTDPGRVNWDSGFVFNIGTVVAIPLLSLVSAFSPLRTDLFSWMDTALRVLSKH